MKSYVLGFAFTDNFKEIVMIEKGPDKLYAGLLNGIGGLIEPNEEDPVEAMVREFEEETGVKTSDEMWKYRGRLLRETLSGENDFEVYIFEAVSDTFKAVSSVTEEHVTLYSYPLDDGFLADYAAPNVGWLLGMLDDPVFLDESFTVIYSGD